MTVYSCWQDHGQGADMGALGTAHEALRPLGLSPERIQPGDERHRPGPQQRPLRRQPLSR